MTKDNAQQDYAAKAVQADERARDEADTVSRNFWLRVADGYRSLARFVSHKSAKGVAWNQSSTFASMVRRSRSEPED